MREQYAKAGVDVDAKDRFIARISPLVKKTHNADVLTGLGHFGGLLSLRAIKDYDDPVLVGCADGVGTKIKLAIKAGASGLENVGVDLVAMCVNDLICCGAKPIAFLDYYASAALDIDQAAAFVAGVARGCEESGCPLIGGETAQMPGLYTPPDFDAAGFCVGVAERAHILGPDRVTDGLVLIGLASSGLHSNGFSLVRKHFSEPREDLLTATRLYVRSFLKLREAIGEQLRAVANITGGGLYENIPRILPAELGAELDPSTWTVPPVIREVQAAAGLGDKEMFATFNGGLGLVLAVESDAVEQALKCLTEAGEIAAVVGSVRPRAEGPALVIQGLD